MDPPFIRIDINISAVFVSRKIASPDLIIIPKFAIFFEIKPVV